MSEPIQSISQGNYILQGTVATSAGIVGDGSTQNPFRADETVLWSGTPTSAVTLSESMQNFDRVRIYFNLTNSDRPKPIFEQQFSNVMTVCWGQGVVNAFITIAYLSANPTAINVVHTKQINFGLFTATAAGTMTGNIDESLSRNSISKVIGINRISG